jgi:hypothetical protein
MNLESFFFNHLQETGYPLALDEIMKFQKYGDTTFKFKSVSYLSLADSTGLFYSGTLDCWLSNYKKNL